MNIRLAELTSPEVARIVEQGAVVVVPIGALEQHGPHLPLETDYRMALTVAEQAAQRATDQGTRVLVTPPIWSGFSPHHMDFSGTITLGADTLRAVVADVARSLWSHGFRHILFLNGHGGNMNILSGMAQQLRFEEGVRIAAASYWSFATSFMQDWRRSGRGGIDHACEMEMSLMLHARPEQTRPELVRDGSWFPHSPFLSGDLLVAAPVSVSWSFSELSEDGTLGDPTAADASRGEELLEVIVERVKDFLIEFGGWDWEHPRDI
jgi:creatinine amidohydrolase